MKLAPVLKRIGFFFCSQKKKAPRTLRTSPLLTAFHRSFSGLRHTVRGRPRCGFERSGRYFIFLIELNYEVSTVNISVAC